MADSHKVYWTQMYITPQTFADTETISATPRLGTFSPFFVLSIKFLLWYQTFLSFQSFMILA